MSDEASTRQRSTRGTTRAQDARRRRRPPSRGDAGRRRVRLLGGTEGNERLTTLTGLVLIVLLAVLGVTIVRIGQLLWLHLFLGLVLIGPVLLKLASTGYRFTRYYTADPAYRRKGPPPPALRGLAPLVVLFTVLVFATGVALLLIGPQSRGLLVLAHKASFIAWIAVTALHVLGHLPEVVRLLTRARESRAAVLALQPTRGPRGARERPGVLEDEPVGSGQRTAALLLSIGSGLVLALALLGQFAAWTSQHGFHGFHH